MDRLDFYFRRLVLESDLDTGFDQAQARIEQAASADETDFSGIVKNADVAESATPDLNVQVSAPAVLYTQEGKRVTWDTTQVVDVSEDELGSSTAVSTPGNSKIISVFAEFDEDLQDPQVDGNGLTVYFERNASFKLIVIQSAEAVSPTPPALRDDAILLVDITRAYGQTTIDNGDMSVTRRQDYFRRVGTNDSIVRGRAKEVLEDLLDLHNTHIDDLADQGASSGATLVGIENFDATPTGGSALGYSDTDVRSALNDLITDLTGVAGSSKIGASAASGSVVTLPVPVTLPGTNVKSQLSTMLDYIETIRQTPFQAQNVQYTPHDYIVATDVQAAIDELIDDLQSQTGGSGKGSFEIGYKGLAGSASFTVPTYTAPADSVEGALGFLLQEINKRVAKGGPSVITAQSDAVALTVNGYASAGGASAIKGIGGNNSAGVEAIAGTSASAALIANGASGGSGTAGAEITGASAGGRGITVTGVSDYGIWVNMNGTTSVAGIRSVGGASDGAGVLGVGGGSNGKGIQGSGLGSGAGVHGLNSAGAGPGVLAESDTTSPAGAALRLVAQDDDPTTPVKGDVYCHTQDGALASYDGAQWGGIWRNVQGLPVDSATITNTTTETQPVTNPGSNAIEFNIPANTLRVGAQIRVRFLAVVTGVTAGPTLTGRFKFTDGSVTRLVGDAQAAIVSANDVYAGEITLICRAIGSGTSAKFDFMGWDMSGSGNGSGILDPVVASADLTFNSTAAVQVFLTLQWDAASSSNIVLLREWNVDMLAYPEDSQML